MDAERTSAAHRERAVRRSAWPTPRALAVLAVVLATPACTEPAPVLLCGEIPSGGCPIGRGGTCDDAACAAVYDCVDGDWTVVEACDGQGTGAGDTGTMPNDGGGGAGGCAELSIDHTGETTGCKPDLQHPDCPIAAAEQCPNSACLTDCVDFFMCTKDGWIAQAYCDENGDLHPTAR